MNGEDITDRLAARGAAVDDLPFVRRERVRGRVYWPDEAPEKCCRSDPWREGRQWALDLARLWGDMPDARCLLRDIVRDATGGRLSQRLDGFLQCIEQLAIHAAREVDVNAWSRQLAEADAREDAAVARYAAERRAQQLAQLAAARAAKAAKREVQRRSSP